MKAIILNAALVPAEGECGIACMQERHSDGLRAAVAAAEREGRSVILPAPSDPEALRRSYGGDPLHDATLAFVADPERSVRIPCTIISSPCTGPPPPPASPSPLC